MTDAVDARQRVLDRVDRQLAWYESHANRARVVYLTLTTVKIVAGAAVTFAAAAAAPAVVTAAIGGLVVVLEGVQQTFQFHSNWIRYRTTTEAIEKERALWAARADVYAGAEHLATLAIRVEALTAGETSAWAKSAAGGGEAAGAAASGGRPSGGTAAGSTAAGSTAAGSTPTDKAPTSRKPRA